MRSVENKKRANLANRTANHLFESAPHGGKEQSYQMAGGPGFEPRLTESESAVLPLNYPPTAAQTRVFLRGRARQ
jgi:hypothetical protein